jgi:outer membrane lipoprotein-sorting protein
LHALAIEAIPLDSPDQVVVMEQDHEGRHSYYILDILEKNSQHDLSLERKIWIDRFDLNVVRQKFFELEGRLESDVTYSDFEDFAGVSYPTDIVFRRPIEDYSLHIKVSKVKMNEVLADDKFILNRPQDAEFVDLSEASKTPAPSQPVF